MSRVHLELLSSPLAKLWAKRSWRPGAAWAAPFPGALRLLTIAIRKLQLQLKKEADDLHVQMNNLASDPSLSTARRAIIDSHAAAIREMLSEIRRLSSQPSDTDALLPVVP